MGIRILLTIAFGLALTGCGGAAKDAVREMMLDPDATQFKDLSRCSEDSEVWRGEANGKNAYGAYTGFKTFMSDGKTAAFAGDLHFEELMKRCYGKFYVGN